MFSQSIYHLTEEACEIHSEISESLTCSCDLYFKSVMLFGLAFVLYYIKLSGSIGYIYI